MSKIYGYARVSSSDQNEDRQLIALRGLGVPERNLFIDKQSGKDFERPAYRKLLRRLRRDDLLYVKSINRLGRNYD
jgi:DNA invertase Pin-like site-specific DNA recombinase